MNSEIEKEMVYNFVIKEKRERILWEIASKRKRRGVIQERFHDERYFIKKILKPVDFLLAKDLENLLFRVGKTKNVYYFGSFIEETTLEYAVNEAIHGDICIIYCGNGIGYYQGEEDIKAPRYLLLK